MIWQKSKKSGTDELETKLYQLFKEDNWSDEAATKAVNAVKGLQKAMRRLLRP